MSDDTDLETDAAHSRASLSDTAPSRRPTSGLLAAAARIVLSVLPSSLGVISPAAAQDLPPEAKAWKVDGDVFGKHHEQSRNLSGIACIPSDRFPRTCVIIDDERQHAQVVTVEDGRLTAGPSIRLIEDHFDGIPVELDGEGVAFGDGYFYVIGSHGRPRKDGTKLPPDIRDLKINAQIVASSRIVRFRLNGDGEAKDLQSSRRLREAMEGQALLKPHLDQPLEENGLTIEGIAVHKDRLLAGFRGPVMDDGTALVLSVAREALFDEKGEADLDPALHFLPLGPGQGVRDLATFSKWVLVPAGPVASGPGQYALVWWDGESNSVLPPKDISFLIHDADHKPEAILPLDSAHGKLRVLVFFDGAKEGKPVPVEIDLP